MTDHTSLIAEARDLTECECDQEGAPMQGCGTHGDRVALLIGHLADALEAALAQAEHSSENIGNTIREVLDVINNYETDHGITTDQNIEEVYRRVALLRGEHA